MWLTTAVPLLVLLKLVEQAIFGSAAANLFSCVRRRK